MAIKYNILATIVLISLQNTFSQTDVYYYNLELNMTNQSTYIDGKVDIAFKNYSETDQIEFQLSDSLQVQAVLLSESQKLKYIHSNNTIRVYYNFNRPNYTLTIYYNGYGIHNGFSGIRNEAGPYGKKVTYTLSEPFGAKYWFPVKSELSDKADSSRMAVRVFDSLVAASNGLLSNIIEHNNNERTYIWQNKNPISYYLISVAIANYAEYSFTHQLPSGKMLLLQNFLYNNQQYINNNISNIDTTGYLINLYSRLFGEYPFSNEKYGHAAAPLNGGMEHQTMSTMGNFSFRLIAHELAHQWFGNYVTCNQWSDIWLNEGFASYAEYLAYEAINDSSLMSHWVKNRLALITQNYYGTVKVSENEVFNPYRIFDYRLSYAKGAFIIHMLRQHLNNDELFFTILKDYLFRYANQVASTQDFIDVLNDNTQNDYQWFFNQWFYGEGYPVYNITWYHNADSLYIISEQLQNDTAQAFRAQLPIQVYHKQTEQSYTILQETALQKFTLPMISAPDSLTVNKYKSQVLKINQLIRSKVPEKNLISIVYPNPANNYINIYSEKFNDLYCHYYIYSPSGKQTASGKLLINKHTAHMPLPALPSGVYLLHIVSDKASGSSKLFIQ